MKHAIRKIAIAIVVSVIIAPLTTRAEVGVVDQMHTLATCVAAYEIVAYNMEGGGNVTMAKLFREEQDKYYRLWRRDFPDIDLMKIIDTVYSPMVIRLKKAKAEGRWLEEWTATVSIAKACSMSMGKMK